MLAEDLRDGGGGKGDDGLPAFRCVLCGELVDPVILTNRKRATTNRDLRKGRTRLHARARV